MSEINNIKDLLSYILRRKRSSQDFRIKHKKDGNIDGYNFWDGICKAFKEMEDLLKELIKRGVMIN